MPFKQTLEEYVRLENEARDRDRRLAEGFDQFLLDLMAMLDVLNSALRNSPEMQSSPLRQRLNDAIAPLRAELRELDAQSSRG